MAKKRTQEPADIPLPEVLAALRNEDEPFPPLFLYRLSDLSPEDLEIFAEAWPEVSTWRRRALLEDTYELSTSNTTLSFEALDRLALTDPDPRVRALALLDIGEYELDELIPTFISLLNNDPDSSVQAAAAEVLGTFVFLGEIEDLDEARHRQVEDALLLSANQSPHEDVRQRALESLGYSSRPEVGALIQQAYESTDRSWVVSALFAIARSYNEQWAGQVLNMLENQHPDVRAMAARAAGELELDDALDMLIEMLDDDNDDARMAAIWSLSQIGGEGVREHLEALAAATDDEDESEFIQNALENLEFTEDIELFDLIDVESPGDTEPLLKERPVARKQKSWETQDREEQEAPLDDDDLQDDEYFEDLDEEGDFDEDDLDEDDFDDLENEDDLEPNEDFDDLDDEDPRA